MSTCLTLLLNTGYEPMQLVLVVSLALACVACLAWIVVSSTPKHEAWYRVVSEKGVSRTGLNAAEKGTSSVAIRAERIPYELEKRAILHRRWMMIGHESQFVKSGDYRTYIVANVPFLVIKGQDGTLRAFHNVCRHRAYTVARKPCGSSLRLACKYHGWQYDAAGQLVKAPQFADKPGFNFAANGLFRIHLRIDSRRFIFINLATELADAFPWTDVSSPSLQTLNLGPGALEWQVELDVGWRVATLLPWFVNGASFMKQSWPNKALTYLGSSNRLRLQRLPPHLGPTPHRPQVRREVHLPPAAHRRGIRPPVTAAVIRLENQVRDELGLAVAALQRHRMATTDLDYQQSAVRERLDKFSRHVHQHRRAETLVGRKINPALRRPTTTNSPSHAPPPSMADDAGSRTSARTDTDNYPIGAGEVISGEAAVAAGVVVVGAAPESSQQQQLQQIQQMLGAGVAVDVDAEAEAIFNALDGLGDGATASACPLLERSTELEW
ncbi:ISP domain-containing protein [Apiospora saccharicola]|uniref:ISP domain-containing protein n=1 Tax=Apiospora saccharicola TaxID=335842 RepID=A0ABR1VNR6_9PEZI